MTRAPALDELERGHVALSLDPFRDDPDAARPWVVANTETHPFHGEQYIVMGLTTRTWYEQRVALEAEDVVHRNLPRESSIVPHAIASVRSDALIDYVCRVREARVDEAVEILTGYL